MTRVNKTQFFSLSRPKPRKRGVSFYMQHNAHNQRAFSLCLFVCSLLAFCLCLFCFSLQREQDTHARAIMAQVHFGGKTHDCAPKRETNSLFVYIVVVKFCFGFVFGWSVVCWVSLRSFPSFLLFPPLGLVLLIDCLTLVALTETPRNKHRNKQNTKNRIQ